MRKAVILAAALLVAAAPLAAETVTMIDDFEAEAAGWAHTGGWSTATHITNDGAEGSTGCVEFFDAGWSMGIEKTYTAVVPENGSYKIRFHYKNGEDGGRRTWPNFVARMNNSSEVALSSTLVTTWTEAETGVQNNLVAGQNVLVTFAGSHNATEDCVCRVDQIKLVKLDAIPIVVFVRPVTGYLLAGTSTLQAYAEGGSGTFTKAEFDVGDDGSIEGTATAINPATYAYEWDFDTTMVADGAVTVRITVTDDLGGTGSIVRTYTIDNANGRETLFTGDFTDWTAGMPDGWTRADLHPDGTTGGPFGTIEAETPSYWGTGLKITYDSQPDPYRYTILSTPFAANRSNYTAAFAANGNGFVRLCYFYTNDGTTWLSTWHLFNPNASAAWKEAVEAPWNPGYDPTADPPVLRPQNYAIATHYYGTGTGRWDEVVITASQTAVDEPASVGSRWDLLE